MKNFLTMLFLTVIISTSLYAQKDTVTVLDTYGGGGEGSLNAAIEAKITEGTLSNTVFKLVPYGLYVLTGTVTTPAGAVLEIVAPTPGKTQATAPPMIAWTVSSAPDKRFNFDVRGDIKMKNVWILYGDVAGGQSGTSLRVGDSSNVVGGVGGRCEFENVMFSRSLCPGSSAGAVEIYSTHFKGKFKNCYFRNCVDPHYMYYGRALSFRFGSSNLHADSVSFENCTFANMGYVFMQEGAEYSDYVYFNHCTFYNIVQFALENGWWNKIAVTNSIFANAWMMGYLPAQGIGSATLNIATIGDTANFNFTVPFTEADRRILFTNNSYSLDTWLVDWMGYGPNGNPYSKKKHALRLDDEIPNPRPMLSPGTITLFDSTDANGNKVFPYRNKTDLYDNTIPEFKNPPLNLDSLKIFLLAKWDDNADHNWAYMPENDYQQIWPVGEDLAYTNTTLVTGGMGGFPLGDLYHWWPTEYSQWKAQADAEKATIINRMENGLSSVEELPGSAIPSKFTLDQNYPNPFNPTTQINYSVPKTGFVSLKVYNTLGQEVATLFEGLQHAGNYVATFDGKGLSSGIFFYRLQSDNISLTKKFVLMK